MSILESIGMDRIIVLFLLAILIIVFLTSGRKMDKNRKTNTKALTYSSILMAMAIVTSQISIIKLPQGGSVSPMSMFMVCLIGYFFGTKQGVIAGVVLGLLNFIIEPYFYHPVQFILDYPLAFGALGLSGLLRNKKYGLYTGYILGVFGRFICSTISGYIFFGSYAPEGMNPLVYTVIYNGTYLLVEAVLTLVIIGIPTVRKIVNTQRTKLSQSM